MGWQKPEILSKSNKNKQNEKRERQSLVVLSLFQLTPDPHAKP
jgi:hypothetical protein